VTTNRTSSGSTGFRAGRPGPGKDAPPPAPDIAVPPSASPPVNSWMRFWFSAADPLGLHCVRVLGCLLFIAWLLPFAGHVDAFFGQQGWLDLKAYEETSKLERQILNVQAKVQRGEQPTEADTLQGSLPTREWSLLYLVWGDSTLLHVFYWGTLAVFFLFALGLWTRVTGVLTWMLVVSYHANPVWRHDADSLLVVLSLYLMVGYLLQGFCNGNLSQWEKFLGPQQNFLFGFLFAAPQAKPSTAAPSVAINLAQRMFQVHFAMIVVVSGLHKLQFGPWWGGVAFLYPLHDPFSYDSYETMRSQIGGIYTNLWVLSLAQYAVLVWQILFPAFAWRQGLWRVVSVGGAAIGWAGSFFLYGQPLFGPFFCIGCLAFLTSAEWRRVASLISGGDQREEPATVAPGARLPVRAAS
jgi:hypothetical protein